MNQVLFLQKIPHLIALTRINSPIGIFLLLWPVLWSLWFAAEGHPRLDVLIIFILGTILTRSAGCAINDYADRHFDGHVARTRDRPLASGALRGRDALITAAILMILAFGLVLLTNQLTIVMSAAALLLASIYPFAKRLTYFPQVILGAAFGFAVPMAWAAQTGTITQIAWAIYLAAILWALAYDTLYAIADREDDIKIGIKSTAILFAQHELTFTGVVQLLVLVVMTVVGLNTDRGLVYFASLIAASGFVGYQLWISRNRDPKRCIQAFLNNNYLGMVIFLGIACDYLLNPATAL